MTIPPLTLVLLAIFVLVATHDATPARSSGAARRGDVGSSPDDRERPGRGEALERPARTGSPTG